MHRRQGGFTAVVVVAEGQQVERLRPAVGDLGRVVLYPERERAEGLRGELEMERMKGSGGRSRSRHERREGPGLMGGKKTTTGLEEEIAALVRAEFAGIFAQLEGDRAGYRRRLGLKQEARRALEEAEDEARRLHSERIALRERFWEAYYGKGEVPFSEVEAEPRSLGRAIGKAERALVKARAGFERADFDEAAEAAALRERADAAVEEADRRVGELQEALGKLLTDVWRDAKASRRALRDELEKTSYDAGAPKG